eukprot:TRINITY_DN10424_c1_g1_i1.p1 TRINITY_DN10424_c1_g1~~TRINITY_DN10424_c1_g1_i1.p1  ORF type:complete len:675 (+),score=44.49 TRINITY_DN10424_c1_g1_i1:147-2027(+)
MPGAEQRRPTWYAVARGRQVGLFPTWAEAEALVKGFPNARFKKFAARADAEVFVAEHRGPSGGGDASNGDGAVALLARSRGGLAALALVAAALKEPNGSSCEALSSCDDDAFPPVDKASAGAPGGGAGQTPLGESAHAPRRTGEDDVSQQHAALFRRQHVVQADSPQQPEGACSARAAAGAAAAAAGLACAARAAEAVAAVWAALRRRAHALSARQQQQLPAAAAHPAAEGPAGAFVGRQGGNPFAAPDLSSDGSHVAGADRPCGSGKEDLSAFGIRVVEAKAQQAGSAFGHGDACRNPFAVASQPEAARPVASSSSDQPRTNGDRSAPSADGAFRAPGRPWLGGNRFMPADGGMAPGAARPAASSSRDPPRASPADRQPGAEAFPVGMWVRVAPHVQAPAYGWGHLPAGSEAYRLPGRVVRASAARATVAFPMQAKWKCRWGELVAAPRRGWGCACGADGVEGPTCEACGAPFETAYHVGDVVCVRPGGMQARTSASFGAVTDISYDPATHIYQYTVALPGLRVWRGAGGALSPAAREFRSVPPGTRVVVAPDVATPYFGWGGVRHGRVGTVAATDPRSHVVTVDFGGTMWKALRHELRCVPQSHASTARHHAQYYCGAVFDDSW